MIRPLVQAFILLFVGTNAIAGVQSRPSSEGFVRADDGIRLHYRIEGEGRQTVLVPASLYLHRDFSVLARGRRVVFYDMRGRGQSDRVDDSTHITIQWDVSDMDAIRRHVKADRVVPVGWSYLGLMVLLYAAEHPDHIERVVQIGPVPRRWDTRFPAALTANGSKPVPDSATLTELAALRRSKLAERDPKAHCQREYQIRRVGLVGDPRNAVRVPDVCDFRNEWPGPFARHLRHHFVGSVQTLDAPWHTFDRITAPVLTVHGTRDRNAPYGGGREWSSRLPNAQLLTVPGAAHMPWLDEPQLVIGAIETFLRGEWPKGVERVRTELVVDSLRDATALRFLKEVEWPRAYFAQDTVLLDRILAPTFRKVDASGSHSDKRTELDWIKENRPTYDSLRFQITRLDVYPNGTAVVGGTGVIFAKDSSGRSAARSDYQSTNILVKYGERWRAIASHVSGVKVRAAP